MTELPNNGMQLTRPVSTAASQLIPSVRRTNGRSPERTWPGHPETNSRYLTSTGVARCPRCQFVTKTSSPSAETDNS
jgi:hypothetical protein